MISPKRLVSGLGFRFWAKSGPLSAVVAIAFCANSSVAIAHPTIDWMKQFGSSSYDAASDIAMDKFGNLLVVGSTQGVLFGENSEGSIGFADGFLLKLDADGVPLWHKRFGAPATNYSADSVATDAAANVYVAGSLGFLSKYDAEGTELWIARSDVPSTHHLTTSNIGIASDGSVFVAGYAARRQCCRWDSYISKFDSDGILAWTQIFEDPSQSMSISSLVVDELGDFYVSGTTGLFNGFGDQDAFVAKFDASGAEKWRRQFGTQSFDGSSSLTIDELGTIFVTGSTEGSLGGPNSGGADMFASGWDSEGNQLWVVQHGSSRDEHAFVSPAIGGGVYFSGGVHSRIMYEFATTDAIVGQLDAEGSLLWMTQFGTEDGDSAAASVAGSGGTLYVVGSTAGPLATTNIGSLDIFFAKFIPTPEPSSATLLLLVAFALTAIRPLRVIC